MLASAVALIPAAGLTAEEDLSTLAERLINLRGEVESLHDEIEAEQQDSRNRLSSLSQRRAELEAQIQRQELEQKKLRRTIDELREKAQEVNEEAASLTPIAKDASKRLQARVSSALPFTIDERLAEVREVEKKLEKGEISAPRALNQLWSFVEDELRLARENGLFRQTITVDGSEQLADVIRVGMTMLFFRTGDGRYGYAERSGSEWTYRVIEGEPAEKLSSAFDDFEKQVRTGFFQLPNGLSRGQ